MKEFNAEEVERIDQVWIAAIIDALGGPESGNEIPTCPGGVKVCLQQAIDRAVDRAIIAHKHDIRGQQKNVDMDRATD